MVEDILQLTYDDILIDSRDALLRHAGKPDFPEWAAEPPGQEQPVMETAAEEQPVQEPETGSDKGQFLHVPDPVRRSRCCVHVPAGF